MEDNQPASSTSFFPTHDQEDWETFFDFSAASAEPPVHDPAVFEGTSGARPDYSGYVAGLQDPPTSFENQAPGSPSPIGTLRDPNLLAPVHYYNTDYFGVTLDLPGLANAANHGDVAVTNVHADYQNALMVRSGSLSLSGPLQCKLGGCQMNFMSSDALDKHQHTHNQTHWVASKFPFICGCEKHFAKLDTLQRHIRQFQDSVPVFPCPELECPRKDFKRKDHLVQHLRHGHNYSEDEIRADFPPRQSIVNVQPVCHFTWCPDYRDASFKNQSLADQEENKPFAKQADYTKHMKDVHEWSPYSCPVPSCDKRGKKGYFSQKSLQKHRDEYHPEAEPITLEPKVVRKLPCGFPGCRKQLRPGSLRYHRMACFWRPEQREA
ncbi:hypothetical protein PG991_001802 [Apiospora marii]|uniref:C2H2-type domain-containing protein n=1 Tax=Apiospora marii TaxID=335849 RepID=A0ABR1SN41_9PEZI